MKSVFTRLLLSLVAVTATARAATDVRVTFTLNTTDAYGVAMTETRDYFVYRPDNLPRTSPVRRTARWRR